MNVGDSELADVVGGRKKTVSDFPAYFTAHPRLQPYSTTWVQAARATLTRCAREKPVTPEAQNPSARVREIFRIRGSEDG